MRRKPIVAANWKLNGIPERALEPGSPYHEAGCIDIIVFPTAFDLRKCIESGIVTGAQHGVITEKPYGAFTGDESMRYIADCGARYVLCGHSERRKYHGETSKEVIEQAVAAMEAGIHPIICVGETIEERKNNRQKNVVRTQLKDLPKHSDGFSIAYEPVWAIGTGETAEPEQVGEMHKLIRSLVGEERREAVRILYGGSVDSVKAPGLIKMSNVDGFLVGSASLKPDEFKKIVDIVVSRYLEA